MCVTMPSPRDSPAPSGERVAPGAIAAAGLVAAVAFTIVVQTLVARRIVVGAAVVTVLGYAAFWVPLAAAVIAWRRGRRLLRFRPVDVLLGVGVGLLARALATGVEFAVYGTSSPAVFPRMLPTGFADAALQVFALVIAPLVLAPVIEELFFRGVVIDAVRGRTALPGSTAIAVVSSAAIFALLHLLGVSTAQAALAGGLSAFGLGLGAAILAVTTGRLGGAVIAHAVFNATIVLLSLS